MQSSASVSLRRTGVTGLDAEKHKSGAPMIKEFLILPPLLHLGQNWRAGDQRYFSFSTSPQSCSKAPLVSGTACTYLILSFSLQSTQDSATVMVTAGHLIQLTCRGRTSQMSCWFQVGTETGCGTTRRHSLAEHMMAPDVSGQR